MTIFSDRLPRTDLLVFGGDVFDTLLSMTDTCVNDILRFFQWTLAMCHQYNVTVRVMAGTHSHDRGQCSVLPHLHHEHLFKNDLRYIDTIRLEHIAHLDLRMLYLPDDLPYESADAVMRVVNDQMHDLGWEYVDYAVVHGWFKNVLPPISAHHPPIVFTTEQFAFVRRWVMAGHVHTPDVFDNVFYNGSTDRLCHGEEETKGCVWVEQRGDGTTRLEFVENRGAAVYKTIDLTACGEIDDAVLRFRQEMESVPHHPVTYIRTIHPLAELRTALQKFCAERYPHARYAHQSPKQEGVLTDEGLDYEAATLITPTPETLSTLILEYLNNRSIGHDLTIARVEQLLAS